MGLIILPYTFSAGQIIVASQHNANFQTIYNLVNGGIESINLAVSAGIADTQLAQIATGGKVNGSALTSLASTPVAAGRMPAVNIGSLTSGCIGILPPANGGSGASADANSANGVVVANGSGNILPGLLRTYDSGWFAITTSNSYVKTHNLNTTNCIVKVYVSENNDGSGLCVDGHNFTEYEPTGAFRFAGMSELTSTTVTVRTAATLVLDSFRSDGTRVQLSSAYARIIMLAFI